MCSFSKEGEQEDVSLCGFAFANGEVGEEQSFASSMSAMAMFHQLTNKFPVADDTGSEWGSPPKRFSFLF